MISFPNEPSARIFLESKNVWGPWFSRLDMWVGQSLPLESVAWLRILGIPLHLLDADVLSQVGESFGKVLHVPRFLDGVQDLSVFSVGVLAGEAPRTREPVNLKWKDRLYRVWVEEEQEVWVPDCLGSLDDDSGDGSSSFRSAPVAGQGSVVGEEVKKSSQRKISEGFEGSHECGGSFPNADSPMHEGYVNPVGGGGGLEDNVGPPMGLHGDQSFQSEVGLNGADFRSGPAPFIIGAFNCQQKRAQRRTSLGSKSSKGRAQASNLVSPTVARPRKRSRPDEEEVEPGFGFIGFTSKAANGSGEINGGSDRGREFSISIQGPILLAVGKLVWLTRLRLGLTVILRMASWQKESAPWKKKWRKRWL
ncbi:hypothetical protein Hanom_Chr01g00050581 [Helianthus anomalus]